jgi:hypothetical protein
MQLYPSPPTTHTPTPTPTTHAYPRFETNTKLCLSMTDFHPESWNPMWSISTILVGVQSFWNEDQHTTGAISTSPEVRRRLAAESLAANLRNPTFRRLFPDWVQRQEERAKKAAAAAAGQQAPAQQAQRAGPDGAGTTEGQGLSVQELVRRRAAAGEGQVLVAQQPEQQAGVRGGAQGVPRHRDRMPMQRAGQHQHHLLWGGWSLGKVAMGAAVLGVAAAAATLIAKANTVL